MSLIAQPAQFVPSTIIAENPSKPHQVTNIFWKALSYIITALEMLLFPIYALVDEGLGNLLGLEVLRHGTSLPNYVNILTEGAQANKGGSDKGSTIGALTILPADTPPPESCQGYVYVTRDSNVLEVPVIPLWFPPPHSYLYDLSAAEEVIQFPYIFDHIGSDGLPVYKKEDPSDAEPIYVTYSQLKEEAIIPSRYRFKEIDSTGSPLYEDLIVNHTHFEKYQSSLCQQSIDRISKSAALLLIPTTHAVLSGTRTFLTQNELTSHSCTVKTKMIAGGILGALTPTLRFKFTPEEVKANFTIDSEYGDLAYKTSSNIGTDRIGIIGSLRQGMNCQVFQRIYNNPCKFLLGLAQLTSAVALTILIGIALLAI